MDSDRPGFPPRSRVNRFNERHIKAAADGKSFGKNGSAGKHCAMRAFLILKKGNLQSSLSQSNFLEPVKVLNLLLGSLMQDGICQSKKAAARSDFIGVASSCESLACLQLFRNRLPELIYIHTR